MNDKQFQELKNEVAAIKNLLILALQGNDVKGGQIAKALGISQGRLSQLFATRRYKKKK